MTRRQRKRRLLRRRSLQRLRRRGGSPKPLDTRLAVDTLLADGRIRRSNPGALVELYETVHAPRRP